jgi:hypothetical protein
MLRLLQIYVIAELYMKVNVVGAFFCIFLSVKNHKIMVK